MVLHLAGDSRKLLATLDIRGYLALFVNKLRGEIDRLVEEIRLVEPANPEWTEH